MKKLIALLLLLFMSVSLIGCSSPLKAGISGKHASRDEIFTYVRNNYQKLMSFPYDEMVEKYPRDGLTSVDNRKEFIESRCESDGMVSGVFLHDGRVLDFYCGSKAAVSGTETVGAGIWSLPGAIRSLSHGTGKWYHRNGKEKPDDRQTASLRPRAISLHHRSQPAVDFSDVPVFCFQGRWHRH